MIAVLDPAGLTGVHQGGFVWSTQDTRVYLLTGTGAIPAVGARGLTSLDEAQLSPIGPDWVRYRGAWITIERPAEPAIVGDGVIEGQLAGLFFASAPRAFVAGAAQASPVPTLADADLIGSLAPDVRDGLILALGLYSLRHDDAALAASVHSNSGYLPITTGA